MFRFGVIFSLFFFVSYVVGSDKCAPEEIMCSSGECIQSNLWCNEEQDCEDGSDEKYCNLKIWNSCPKGYFKCGGWCIPAVSRCNGFKNCEDGSDEMNCNTTQSSSSKPLVKQIERDEELFDFEVIDNDLHATKEDVQDYVAYSNEYSHQIEKAREWLLAQMRADHGWGEETPRAVVALRLSQVTPFGRTDLEKLVLKQLHTEIAIAISRNYTNPISLTDLALYINALTVTCQNAKNFHGYDLVSILRDRVDIIHNWNINPTERSRNPTEKQKFVPPLVYLTLCLSNVSNHLDLRSIREIASKNIQKIDILSLASLAASCMSNSPFYDTTYGTAITSLLIRKIQNEALPGNLYELALLFQAMRKLFPVRPIPESNWSFDAAMKSILDSQNSSTGSFGDILATYYALPILAGRSLMSLESICRTNDTDLIPLEVLKNNGGRKIFVDYSLEYGFPLEKTQAMKFRVAEGTSIFDIMRLAEEINPCYRFQLDENKSKPTVYSIGGVPNDAEKGKYWIPHVRTFVPGGRGILKPFEGDIKNFPPKNNDEIVFWFQTL